MGFETIPGSDLSYGLISFDSSGKERTEESTLMSEALLNRTVSDSPTDIFFFCHGWKGDVPAAKDQYGKWIGAFVRSGDRQMEAHELPGFRPMFIGLHWPSQPWGDEELRPAGFGSQATAATAESMFDAYLDRLGGTLGIREPLQVIFDEARHNAAPGALPPRVRQAYLDLNDALGLKSEGVAAPPDADREGFDPDAGFDQGGQLPTAFGGDLDLGGLFGPLRQLSYWTMKKRARTIGEGGMHDVLVRIQQATAEQKTRVHLMGHSFGTIVVSGMVGGPDAQGVLPRPVNSLVLVQGAVSLWCYASEIPFPNAGAGYFNRILTDGKILGPLIATRSRFDAAVGTFYPLASRISGAVEFAAGLPKFGAIGAYGLQGVGGAQNDLLMVPDTGAYSFERGKVYNLDGSQFICKGEGASGAHSDIAGPEVAHALWTAALASVRTG